MAETSSRHVRAATVIRIASLWVAAGALFKLFAGSPNDLQPLVQNFVGDDFAMGPVQIFRTAIMVELCIVILAFLRPRHGWLPLMLLFIAFDIALAPLVAEGAESCGCFGSDVPLKPWMMMAIDTVFLLLLLGTTPWRALEKRPLKPILLVPLFALSIWAPTYFVEGGVILDGDNGGDPGELEGDYHVFQIEDWEGNMLHDTDLGQLIDADLVPVPCHIILYRQTCEHCAEHFEKITGQPRETPLVLVRIPEKGDTPEKELTKLKPDHALHREVPLLERGYLITTPVALDIDEFYMVEKVYDREELDK